MLGLRKQTLAGVLNQLGVLPVFHSLSRWCWRPYIRVVNYHEVEPAQLNQFEKQLRFLARYYEPIDEPRLSAFLQGRWQPQRPGLLFTFDDGWRCHATLVAPLLERYGFRGWFFVPAGYVLEPNSDWLKGDPRRAWLEPLRCEDLLGLVQRGHAVGCHTYEHRPLPAGTKWPRLHKELITAKQELELLIGQPITAFAWVRGNLNDYGLRSSALLPRVGFQYAFQTTAGVIWPGSNPMQLPRTNLEARFPISLVRYQLSGMQDVQGWSKARCVNAITAMATYQAPDLHSARPSQRLRQPRPTGATVQKKAKAA